jgi:hypothetical protein
VWLKIAVSILPSSISRDALSSMCISFMSGVSG